MKSKVVTTPIFYVNARPHLGHLFSGLVADCAARSSRMGGEPVLFSTGTDEHGTKVAKAAESAGVDVKGFCDEVSKSFGGLFRSFGCSHDVFVRTTDREHVETVQWLWKRLERRGYLYSGVHGAFYDASDEVFVKDHEVERVDGEERYVVKDTGNVVTWVEEENTYFRLGAFEESLRWWLEVEGNVIPEGRRNEVLGILGREDLGDLSVSRPSDRVPWGIEAPGREGKETIYVWLDALTNYLTVAGGWRAVEIAERNLAVKEAKDTGESVEEVLQRWEKEFSIGSDGNVGVGVQEICKGIRKGVEWTEAKTCAGSVMKVVDRNGKALDTWGARGDLTKGSWPPAMHVIGKDITRFHCMYWPAFLAAAGLALPNRVVAHGHWMCQGRKMSKSIGNVVDPLSLCIPDSLQPTEQARADVPAAQLSDSGSRLFHRDVLRYALLTDGSIAGDGDFSTQKAEQRYEDLADTFGNLLSRATAPKILTTPVMPHPDELEWTRDPRHHEIASLASSTVTNVQTLFNQPRPALALEHVRSLAHSLNAYFAGLEPWALAKSLRSHSDPQADAALRTTLFTSIHGLRLLGTMLQPVMPSLASRALDFLQVPHTQRTWAAAFIPPPNLASTAPLPPGSPIAVDPQGNRQSLVLFPKK